MASAYKARPGSQKMVTAPLVALGAAFLLAAAGAEEPMELAIPTKIGGRVYLVIKGFTFDTNGEKLEQVRSGSASFTLAADGLYYYFIPGFASYHNSVPQCAALGARIGVARTSLTLEIMRALHLENGETSAWIGLFQTLEKNDLHWLVDGSLFNTNLLTSNDKTLAKAGSDTAYYFSSGALQYSNAPSTDLHGVICQANYFGAFW